MTIGSAQGDMIIDDPGIAPSHIRIEVTPQGPAIVNLVPAQPASLNGQPLGAQAVPLKANDNLLVGSTTIFFNSIDASVLQPPPPFTNDAAAAKMQREGSKEHAIFNALDILARKEGAGDVNTGAEETGGTQPPPAPPKQEGGGPQPPPVPDQSAANPPVPPPPPGKPDKQS